MAPLAAPGPDLKNLSSNWKKLQAQLPPKRKQPDAESHPHLFGPSAKRTKVDGAQAPMRNKMSITQKRPLVSGHKVVDRQQPAPASLALWAADNDIPRRDILAAYGEAIENKPDATIPVLGEDINAGLSSSAEAGKYVAIDCEMVGVGPNPDRESALARVSVVNFHGHQLYDSFVQPKEAVTDYRTHVSGITESLLQQARTLEVVQADVTKLIDGKILVGHSVRSDLEALFLSHPSRDVRDTSKHSAFRQLAKGRTPGLKRLAKEILGLDIQGGEHSSVEDARATMLLFRKEKAAFDREHITKWGVDRKTEAVDEEEKAKSKKKKKKANKKKKKARN